MPGVRPAAVKANGTTVAKPAPTAANPISPVTGVGLSRTSPSPPKASAPLQRTMATGPICTASKPPPKRPSAMVTEKAAYPIAANPSDVFATCRKKTALQSAIAPSPSMTQKASAPKANSAGGGQPNLAGETAESSGARLAAASPTSNSRGKASSAVVPPRHSAMTVKWTAGAIPAVAAIPPRQEPTSPPTLNSA